ncbi:carbon-nitrogen hydrolase family protein [Microbacterium sp. Marseille-Q6965]|uniref:carbon-nitrogen hydrolase family protein n=1 Tax=Microbacterium sp. Marseille-Q6965 TaxID=2965072 RepID=UPI0021B74F2C|nr:carbon-nitrogen hydrolase family protein [Microbacterium sp. Marseille-Q6965]
MAAVGIAVGQFAPTADKAGNLSEIDRLAREARSCGARVALFPEYSSYFVNPMDPTLARESEPVDGPFTARLRALAAELDMTLVAGLIETGDNGRVRNTAVAVDGSGVIAAYRKQHLYDAFGQRESDWVEPGAPEQPHTFAVDGLAFGLMTCYDLRFPEISRMIVDAGAEVILVPAEWVRGPLKEHHWTTLLAARAIENTVFVAAADHPAPIGVGRSAVLDPQGVALAGLGAEPGLAIAWLDPDAIRRTRAVNPALEMRRYGVVPRR